MDTSEKVYNFLCYLKQAYRNEIQLSLSTLCKINEIPNEYGKWIVEDGLLLKVGKLRGPAKYKWNPEKEPTEEVAELYRVRYLEVRNVQLKGREKKNATTKETTTTLLYEIRDMLKKLTNEQYTK